MTTALIIDDHPIVLQGFIRSVEAIGACKAVGSSSLADGFRRYRQIKPDIIVLDLSFRDNAFAGLSLLRRLRRIDATTPILVFSMHDDPTVVKQVLVAGANGYVQKDIAPEMIGEAFTKVLSGAPFLTPELATRVALLNQRQENPILESLSSREMEILALISRGSSYTEIADQLGISYKTVANTASNLKAKLSARSLPELVIKSIRLLQ
ncbi:DNA-binding response regulator [Fulvimarina endophytica]|uniref:DNA-binding response regulator n=1 Tax=Fulvimarina endophytica TaxID=2293836 RepID=A0A371X2R3_9HYPH|nr:response regulator transcription factor [Fulvimarina endophytica]RFC63512.1 DNA-binding response regulator [Fulvimarina endophytica]